MKTKNSLILKISEADASMISITGGKGANLGELAQTGFPVPEGFCITTAAWDLFLRGIPEKPDFTGEENHIRELSSRYRHILREAPFPVEVSQALEAVLQETGLDEYYAVRSSATAEDLPGFSFAGQQDTYLNIKGRDALEKNIQKCWASLFTERAVMYRYRNGFSQKSVKLAVVVQKMIAADASGILFTADPLSGSRNIITIDAGFGLGETLVSGLINPDSYTVDKKRCDLLSVDVKEKKIALYTDRQGGTQKITLDKEKALSRVLSDSQIKELCTLACRVEDHFQSPQDIEWGMEHNRFYLLQARPVTTLFPLPHSPRGRKDHRIFISLGHVQVMTAPISPMGRSVIKLFLPFGRPKVPGMYNPYITEAGERIYTDITPLLSRKFLRKRYPSILEGIDPLLGRGVQEALSKPEVLDAIRRSEKKIRFRPLLAIILKMVPEIIKGYFAVGPVERAAKVTGDLEESLSLLETRCSSVASLYERLILLRDYTENYVEKVYPLLGSILPALVSWKFINKYMKEWTSGGDVEEALRAVERGLVGNITTTMDLETGDLANLLSDNPLLVALFKSGPVTPERIKEGREIEGSQLFYRYWDRFMKRFGMRGMGEFDIRNKRWKDSPGSFVTMLLSQVSRDEKGSHRRHFESLTAKAQEAASFLCSKARQSAPQFAGMRRERRIKKLLSLYRGYMPLREHGKYYLMRLFDIMRRQILTSADEFISKGILSERDSVWFLEYNELLGIEHTIERNGLLSSKETALLNEKIVERKKRFEDSMTLDPPRVILGDGTIPRPSYATEGFPPEALIGAGVSAGIAEGKARVIRDPESESLLPGEILVAPFTDPAWTPLFINAAAVVIEVGGKMTHGSVIAREYGIPAVVSLPDVTTIIQTGQKLRVNGDKGYVLII